MTAADAKSTTFRAVLDLRGRVLLFTPNAQVGLAFERMAERHHAQVICTRGWADPYGPIGLWHRVHSAREYGVLSCDQVRYIQGVRLPCTDIVWVGQNGTKPDVPHLRSAYRQAMTRGGDEARRWLIGEEDL